VNGPRQPMPSPTACKRCGELLSAYPDKATDGWLTGVCPRPLCRALREWTAERWAGAGRMAMSRRATGLLLSDLDVEALDRMGIPA
jgi:hypothetical protein